MTACADGLYFCEDFEGSATGTPSSTRWTIESRAATAAIETARARGKQALHLSTTDNGAAFIVPSSFKPTGNSFFGRMWVWVDAFPTKPDYAHFTLVEAGGANSSTDIAIPSPITISRTFVGEPAFIPASGAGAEEELS